MGNRIDVYVSDDYAGLETDYFTFYFGYEVGMVDGKVIDVNDTEEEYEWTFVSTEKSSEYKRYIPESKLRKESHYTGDDMAQLLLIGIGLTLNTILR